MSYRAVFGVGEFRVLFGLHTLFVVGDTVRMLGLSVLVYEKTGSALASALAYGAGMLPYVVGGAFLLALADRVPPRPLLVAFHVLRAAVTAVLALGVPTSAAILLTAAIGLFAPVATASVTAVLPDLLPGDGYVLGRSLFTMTAAGAQIGGNAAGGLLLLAVGPEGALWLAAGSALVAAAVARAGVRRRPPRKAADGASVRETWRVNRILLADRGTRRLLLAQWLPISLAVGSEGVVIPYAAQLGRPDAAGAVLASYAAGMLAGNLVVGRIARRERLTRPLAVMTGLPLLAFAARPGAAAACALAALAAFGLSYELGLQRPFLDRVPEDARGQALGLANIGVITGQAACVAAAGALGEILPPGAVMALFGAASAVAACALVRAIREPAACRP
ncbi:MFS transporter [Actinomadura rubrobrunea]|uniref:MFS transporter n=1 Tax=Actinomadura rubrobrunea TaxID=115335 RepID=A0A9W6UW20_9ACTN|nr:MFS transporter [Actinomadura rubrobrunea]GLW63827.1 MFS transporter [Actinomadura rubrobrunea]